MKKTGMRLALVCAMALACGLAAAEEEYGAGYQPFSSGNTILVCNHPPDARITQKNFDTMFPALSVYVYEKWKSGIVSNAYFLATIDQGILLVVREGGGRSSSENAKEILTRLVTLFAEADVPLKAKCVLHDVGPIWLDDASRTRDAYRG